MRRVMLSFWVLGAVLCTTIASLGADSDGSLLGPHFADEIAEGARKYLASVGWKVGTCSRSRLESGLTAECDVLPSSGPGSHPPRQDVSASASSASIYLICEEDNGGIFEFTETLNPDIYDRIPIYSRTTARFRNGIPIYIINSMKEKNKDAYEEFIHIDILKKEFVQYFGKTPVRHVDDKDFRENTVLFVERLANLEQFVCRAAPEKRKRYFDLLSYNRKMLK